MTTPVRDKPDGNEPRHEGPDSRRHADNDSDDNEAPRRKYEIREGNSLSPRYEPSPRRDHRTEENPDRRATRYDDEREVPRDRENPEVYDRYERVSHGEGRLGDPQRETRRNEYETNGDRRGNGPHDARNGGDEMRQNHENHDSRPTHMDGRREAPEHQGLRDGNDMSNQPMSGDKPQGMGKHSDHMPIDGGSSEGLVNLFVRNVARHVMEQQLVDLFSKVSYSSSSTPFSCFSNLFF